MFLSKFRTKKTCKLRRFHNLVAMNPVKFLLAPFALIYGTGAFIRNKLYDYKILKSTSYKLPVISLGNLAMGGTGKTPHVEYLIRLLHEQKISTCTLSRGYGRKTKGYLEADNNMTYKDIGDEPIQYFSKFKNLRVFVDESRKRAIRIIRQKYPDIESILLDDAFQHRSVKPGLNIMLTDYHRIYTKNYVFPMGNLREKISGAERADIILVTKTGPVLSPITRKMILEDIKPLSHQSVFFSFIVYEKIRPLPGISPHSFRPKINTIILLAGIANPYPLEYHLKNDCYDLITLKYPDHHHYTEKDILDVLETYNELMSQNKVIITTEKDAMRLQSKEILEFLEGYPVFYIPIRVKFHDKDGESFNQQVLSFIDQKKS